MQSLWNDEVVVHDTIYGEGFLLLLRAMCWINRNPRITK